MGVKKDGETRRSILIQAAVGVAATAGSGAEALAQSRPGGRRKPKPKVLANKRIRAVAVGAALRDVTFDNPRAPIPAYVRPYIAGLIAWLAAPSPKSQPRDPNAGRYNLGAGDNEYVIEYRERTVTDLASAFTGINNDHVLFCMSTSVGDAAVDYLEANNLTTPVVVISSHFDNFEQDNVCVVSAQRPQLIRKCYDKFKGIHPTMTKTYALYRQDNYVSYDALRKLKGRVEPIAVADNANPATVVAGLRGTATDGLLVLPLDRFFAYTTDIVTAAGSMPTYWTTPDWPAGLMGTSGAHGYKQNLCGRYMAERVAQIWERGMPNVNPKDKKIPPGELSTVP
jgi:hypothetical protein